MTAPLLFWDFENVMSERGVSISVGIPAEPGLASGFVSQTGGGPAETFGDGVGVVFLTRHLGTNDMFAWLTVTNPVFLDGVTFRHFHNHNPGFPTHPGYRIQLQLDSGDGYEPVGQPLELGNHNYGRTDTIEVGRRLEAGSHKLRWHPKGLKKPARDTASEFFAVKDLSLTGRVLAEGETPPTPCAARPEPEPAPRPAPAEGYVTLGFCGVTVERLKVMESKYGGTCSRSGQPFPAGTTIGFKHRGSLTDEQKAAIFPGGEVGHVTVVLTAGECGGHFSGE